MSRTYPLYVCNPVSDHLDEVKKLIENGTLTLIKEVPSVTTVTEARGIGWPMLYSAVSLTKQGLDYRAEWKGAADRGTFIHQVAEDLATWGLPEDDETWLIDKPEDCQGLAKALLAWWKVYQPKVIEKEFLVFSQAHQFAGRADVLATLLRKVTLIDYKSVKTSDYFTKYPKSFDSNRIEVVARMFAMREAGRKVEQAAIVRFAPDGKYDQYIIPQAEEQGLMDCFIRARHEWDFLREDKEK